LLNGKLDNAITGPYMKMLTDANVPFTLVANETAQTADKAAGLLIVADTAINQSNVDLPPLEQDPEKPKKRGFDFFKKL
ncbi:MAG: YueI family protein, partial [Lacticaseibacillus paracasei]|nr:YueI family protein [Lacticaseibacillus paracasei]